MRPFIRLIGFLVFFALIVFFADAFLIRTDMATALMMQELKEREDIELCFIGSSVVRDHFNAPMITQRTGIQSFSASVLSANLPADIALAEELFRDNHPEYVVLVLDRFNLNTAKESLETTDVLMPLLSSWRTRLHYYRLACAQDGAYIDRLFLFRQFSVKSPTDVLKTIVLRQDAFAALETMPLGQDVAYMGAGYLRCTPGTDAKEEIRRNMIRVEDPPGNTYDLLPATRKMLLEFKALCEQNGAKLFVLLFPVQTAQALSMPDCLPYFESLVRFCEEQHLPCFNFAFAKPSLLPCLDDYYFDLYHLNGDGADLFSAAFADFFLRYTAGGDVSEFFYANADEYLASIDFITNVWLTAGESGTWTADCNRGPSVKPLYRFVLRGADGSQELLRDYDQNPVIEIAGELKQGCELRVYARSQSMDQPVYFDYPSDSIAK